MSKPDLVPSRSIDVTSSSPAPSSTARTAQSTASRPAASRPPLTTTSKPDGNAGLGDRRASIATTTAWLPNRAAHAVTSAGSATAAVFRLTLSAPARSTSRISSTLRTPPPTVSGMNARRAVRSTMSRSVPGPRAPR